MADVFDEPGNDEIDLETMETTEVVEETVSEPEATETRTEVEAASEEIPEEPKPENNVPLSTFLEEKNARKALQAEIEQLKNAQRSDLDALKDQLNALRKGDEQKAEEQAFEEDPITALRNQQKKIAEDVSSFKNEQQATKEQQEQMMAFQNAVTNQVEEFKQHHPDYVDRFQFVQGHMDKYFKSMGYNEMQRAQAFDNWAINVSQDALQRGINPGQIVYDMSQEFGFAPPKAEEESKLDTIQKGQEKSKTLSDSGGRTDQGFSLADIESMSDDEFDKFWADLENKAR